MHLKLMIWQIPLQVIATATSNQNAK